MVRMKSVSSIWLMYLILAMVSCCSLAEGDNVRGKRYVAALAKNGRLPKFSNAAKKSSQESLEVLPTENQMYSLHDDILIDYPSDPGNAEDATIMESKRNVASLARMGRLNAIRFGRFQSNLVGNKRLDSDESREDPTPEINDDLTEIDCIPDADIDVPSETNPNFHEKRYVAALARSGRLPVWHSQRMWGTGKRYDNLPYWDSSAYVNDNGDLQGDSGSFDVQKLKRCKKQFDSEMEKRNLAALAKNGRLPFSDGKRNIAALARDGKLQSSNYQTGKRSVAYFAKSGKLPLNKFEPQKRNIQALARNGRLAFNIDQDGKRNIQSMARNGKLPFNSDENDKRNVQSMARNGKLPFNSDQSGKRNIQSMARNGKLPSFSISNEDKRNVAALAGDEKLPIFVVSEENKGIDTGLPRSGNSPYGIYPGIKRNIQAMARNGKLPFNNYEDEKRNIQSMARNGNLPLNNFEDEKRNIQSMARNGNLPFNSYQNEKRNIQAMARGGKLLFNSYPNYKRSEEDSESNELDNDFELEKRNLAALARNGKLPFRNQDEKA